MCNFAPAMRTWRSLCVSYSASLLPFSNQGPMMTQADVTELLQAFEECTLPREKWTHRAHLWVALWYLRHFPREEATKRIRTGIQRYNAARGSTKGYHETITLSWIRLLSGFLLTAGPQRDLGELASEAAASYASSDYLLRYYSHELLFSDRARTEYVPPDLRPLDGTMGINEDDACSPSGGSG